jgi:hypothetical protein
MGQQAEVSGFIREGNFSGQRDLCTPRPQLGEASAAAPVPVGPGDVLRKKERNHMPTFDKILPYNMKSFIMNSSLERKIIRDGGQVRAWIFPGPALSSFTPTGSPFPHVSQLSVAVTKYLGEVNLKEERFIMAHGFSPRSADSFALGLR